MQNCSLSNYYNILVKEEDRNNKMEYIRNQRKSKKNNNMKKRKEKIHKKEVIRRQQISQNVTFKFFKSHQRSICKQYVQIKYIALIGIYFIIYKRNIVIPVLMTHLPGLDLCETSMLFCNVFLAKARPSDSRESSSIIISTFNLSSLAAIGTASLRSSPNSWSSRTCDLNQQK